MNGTTTWTLLRAGKREQLQALKQLQSAYASDRNGSTIMELGVAFLWLHLYEDAWQHFRAAIKEFPIKGDSFYGMAGVAKWCLGKPSEAVLQWRAGLGAKYARASGLGVRMPLLLFFASVLRPNIFEMDLAKTLMLEKAKDPRIKTWPGPIAELVLEQTTADTFQNHCRGANQQDTKDRQWLADIYRTLMEIRQTTPSLFKRSMRRLTDTDQPEWQTEAVFLGRIWNEEYFLARHEAR